MRKQVITAATAIVLGMAAGIGGAMAAETGTKTMPDSSIYPPYSRHRPLYNFVVRHHHHHECYLPLSRCNNEHRVQN